MNIYLVSQDLNNGYDTYDSFVCIAESEQEAREIYPSRFTTHHRDGKWFGTYTQGGEYEQTHHDWVPFADIDKLKVKVIGVASYGEKKGVVLASYNAG